VPGHRHAFLAHDGDEEQWIDAEFAGLRLDGTGGLATGNHAAAAESFGDFERRLPSQSDGAGRSAGCESVAPGEQGVDVLLRGASEQGGTSACAAVSSPASSSVSMRPSDVATTGEGPGSGKRRRCGAAQVHLAARRSP